MNNPRYKYRCTKCKVYRTRPWCVSCGPAAVLVKVEVKKCQEK